MMGKPRECPEGPVPTRHLAGAATQPPRADVREIDVIVACADEDARRIVGAVLRHEGWRVAEVGDPAAVLPAALAGRPVLVVASHPTPAGEGCTITGVLRAHPGTADIPILNVTSRAFPADIARAGAAGATASLVMPVAPLRIAEEARRMIEGSGATLRDERVARRGPRRDRTTDA